MTGTYAWTLSAAALCGWFVGVAHARSQPTEAPAPVSEQPSAPAQAPESQEARRHLETPVPTWTLQFEPMAWYAGAAGEVRLPGTRAGGGQSRDVDLSDLNLDSTQLGPAGEFHLNVGRWRVTFSGAALETGGVTTAEESFRLGDLDIVPGESLDVSLELTTAQLTAGYLVWARDFAARSENPDAAIPSVLRIYVLGGARLTDLDIDVRRTPGGPGERAGSDQFLLEPIVGARAEFDVARDFTIDLELSGGGFGDSDRTSASFDIALGFHWRPVENVGIQIGWRQVAYWIEDGEGPQAFEYSGEVAGLFAGITLRF